ncbi:MAG: M20 family metallopeptidase [Clostridiaceae bacterium]
MLKKVIKDLLPEILAVRCDLHENAEVSMQEFKTQKIIMDFLSQNNIDHQPFTGTGVVANFNAADNCVAVRADIDALAINGASHLCGHDYHTAILLGVAKVLKELNYSKPVKLIFQPAEEAFGGALKMIQEGVLENPKVDRIIGYHVWPKLPLGKIALSGGPSMASVDDFYLTFIGKGGHAAFPHLCKNPIFPAMELIQNMNNKYTVDHDPNNPYVLTFASIKGGEVPNVICEKVEIMGTLRTFDETLRDKIVSKIEATAKTCAESYECEFEINYDFAYPPVVSDYDFSKEFSDTAKKLLGEDHVLPLQRSYAAEDFSFFCREVPGVHFRIGISNEDKGNEPLHSLNFNADDECVLHGIHAIVGYLISLE